MIVVRLFVRAALVAAVLNAASASAAYAQSATDPTPEQPNTVTCESREGEREYCPANTSAGVALLRSTGTAPCLLGKTWGYDDGGIWMSDGCSGEFIAGQVAQEPTKRKALEYVPNAGFLLYDGEKGQIYFRLFSYAVISISGTSTRLIRIPSASRTPFSSGRTFSSRSSFRRSPVGS